MIYIYDLFIVVVFIFLWRIAKKAMIVHKIPYGIIAILNTPIHKMICPFRRFVCVKEEGKEDQREEERKGGREERRKQH